MNTVPRLLLSALAVFAFLIWKLAAASGDAAPVGEADSVSGRKYEPAIFPLYFLTFGICSMLLLTLMAALGIFKEDASVVFVSHLTVYIGIMVQIRCPVLVIGGEQDHVIPAGDSRHLAEAITGSALYLYPQYGHGAFEEAKDFQDRLIGFFSGPETIRSSDI